MFEKAHHFNINDSVFNSIQGDFIQVNHAGKDEQRDLRKLCKRLSQTFEQEPFYSWRHEQNLRRTTEGTCRWLFDDPNFLQWRDDPAAKLSVLWAHGSPGSGKSALCSQVIQSLANDAEKNEIAYHFCDFAREYKAIEVLSMLACQLLDVHIFMGADISPFPLSILNATTLQLKQTDFVKDVIRHLVLRSRNPIVYFLLDGLDEELGETATRWNDAIKPVLRFLNDLALEHPQRVRLWISSQRREKIKQQLVNFCEIDIDPFARHDIMFYLAQTVPLLIGPTESHKNQILHKLQDRAECSFIWARLMSEELMQRPSLSSMMDFIGAGSPRSLEEYYKSTFDRFPQNLRPLASMVFSMVLYAKRPLRFSELWEALWCLSSKHTDVMCSDDKPYKSHIHEVFQPFIELVPVNSTIDEGEDDDAQYTCRLVHSTLNSFLLEHLMIPLSPDEVNPNGVYVCPEIPIRACLNYLLQSRFAELLQKKDGKWHDINGIDVMDNRFLIYAAKHWYKHLDGIVDPKTQTNLIPRTLAFVRSPNFWTVVQVQTIWVQAQFSTFHQIHDGEVSNIKHLRRMFPKWFIGSEDGIAIWFQYRSFLRQWRYFLCCGQCIGIVDSKTSPCTGEIEHIWTGALGNQHFLKERKSSLLSYSFSSARPRGYIIFFADMIDKAGKVLTTLQISLGGIPPTAENERPCLEVVLELATLDCLCRTWELRDGAAPVLTKEQNIQLLPSNCDFDLYVHNPNNPYSRSDRAPLAAFSSNGEALRIGSCLYKRGDNGSFSVVSGIHGTGNRRSRYFEEFSRHGDTLVLASRTRLSNKDIKLHYSHEDSDEEIEFVDSDSDEEDSRDIETDDSGSSSDLEFASDDDSISDGSSVFSNEDGFEDDMLNPWADYHIANSDSDGSSDGGMPCIDLSDSSDSDSEEDTDNPAAFGRHLFREEEDEDWEGLPQYYSDQKPSHSKARATISLFDTSSGTPVSIFKKEFPLRCKIYNSAPVFHQRKPLVVWPLGDGDILFIDYEHRKSFTRILRPSTSFTRQISVQCVFSTCGKFMHIAALEGRRPDPKTTQKMNVTKLDPHPIHLAMLVSTYRLSSQKATRSPPPLIHRTRIDLKTVKSINTRQLPFSLTWAEEYLYVTASFQLLQVWRVPLFRDVEGGKDCEQNPAECPNLDDTQPVMTPEKPVFMPRTCKQRSVWFFPQTCLEARGLAKIVVGHEASVIPDIQVLRREDGTPFNLADDSTLDLESHSTLLFEEPVVCYLDTEKNLGEWVDSKARTKIIENMGVGHLDARMEGMEKFNPDDDCELEPYYY